MATVMSSKSLKSSALNGGSEGSSKFYRFSLIWTWEDIPNGHASDERSRSKLKARPRIGTERISVFFDLVMVIFPWNRSTSVHFKHLISLYRHPVLRRRTTKVKKSGLSLCLQASRNRCRSSGLRKRVLSRGSFSRGIFLTGFSDIHSHCLSKHSSDGLGSLKTDCRCFYYE